MTNNEKRSIAITLAAAAVAVHSLGCAARGRDRPPETTSETRTSSAEPALGGDTRRDPEGVRDPWDQPPIVGARAGTSVDEQSGARPLEAREIHEGVAQRMDSVRQRCASIERKIDGYETTLHLEIGASGRVEVARARGNHPIVDACVADVARAWVFPASAGRSIADVPITLLRVDGAE